MIDGLKDRSGNLVPLGSTETGLSRVARGPGSRPRHSVRRPVRLGYQPALDGLRGIGVISVLLYHGGVEQAAGGFLGVDVFFVLSGFLITWLLLTEHETTARIGIGAFYLRRARRLFPALALVLVGVAGYTLTLADAGQVEQLRGDLVAAFAYVTNWRLIGQDRGYFDAFAAPSPLQHTWSLAVEEQWYLLWPVVMAGLLWVVARTGRRWLIPVATAALALASLTATMVLAGPGLDPSRVYYGTDTRAHQLLLGALLAIVRQPIGVAVGSRWRGIVELGGLASLGWLAWLATTVNDRADWLFDGGLALVALATCAVIMAAVQPSGLLPRLLAARPLRSVGLISYGLYLWHFPLFVVLSSTRTGISGTALLVVRLCATAVAALASYHLVERPMRDRSVAVGWPSAVLGLGMAAALAAVLLVGAPVPRSRPAALDAAEEAIEAAATPPTPTPTRPPGEESLPTEEATPEQLEWARQFPSPVIPSGDGVRRVLVMGDSVALTLQQQAIERVDTANALVWDFGVLGCSLFDGDRRFRDDQTDGGAHCQTWRSDRPRWIREFAPDVVIVLSGVWETYDRVVEDRELLFGSPEHDAWFISELDQLVDLLGSGGARVVLVTAPCNRRTEGVDAVELPENRDDRVDHLNALYRQVDRSRADVSLLDLHELVCPGGRYLTSLGGQQLRYDGVHFTPEGAKLVREWVLDRVLDPVGVRRLRRP